jgi:putative radical SAM enzyme (TIGR03279 family)
MTKSGIKILDVRSRSSAKRAGLKPGDIILRANEHAVDDELALRFYLSDEQIELCIRHADGTEECLSLDLSRDDDPGIEVEEFRTQVCKNACLFCFVDQLPKGVRTGLKVKDDDFRLSFLHGNYITLTNVTDRELTRIIDQRLSPLYVSVHATDPALRTWILGRKKIDNLDRKLRALVRGGILIHAQVVLMPGINDGKHLEKTVRDLYRLHPGVASVAIVPIGLSEHGRPKDRLEPVTPEFSKKVIRAVTRWQEAFRAESGSTFAYVADEFYLQAGVDIPESDSYDDFAQIEDGIGMTRCFLDEFETEMKRRKKSLSDLRGTLVSGRLFAPVLRRNVTRLNRKFGSRLRVLAVENRFLGKKITVAGLLGGQDILRAVGKRDIGDFLIIPNEAISRVDGILVDDLTPKDLSKRLGKPVYASGRTMRDFFNLIFRLP